MSISNRGIAVIASCSELIQALCKADQNGWFPTSPKLSEEVIFDLVVRALDKVVEACESLEAEMRQLKSDYYKSEEKYYE